MTADRRSMSANARRRRQLEGAAGGEGVRIASGLLSLLLVLGPTMAFAECEWVLWVEGPVGSDQWSVASGPQSRFTASKECQRVAADLNANELTMVKGQGTSSDTRDEFSCLPCTVDPRPEAALLHEGLIPRGLKPR